MEKYAAKADVQSAHKIVLDDMILTKALPTAAGSKMLDGFMSLFDATVVTRLEEAGYGICGKAAVGEFAIDVMGETSYKGAVTEDGKLVFAAAQIVKEGEAEGAIVLDVNGTVRRAAAQSGLVSLKPTYGTVSRFGTVPVACSGETVSVLAKDAAGCRELLGKIVGHDDQDGTSLPAEKCALVTESAAKLSRVALVENMLASADSESAAKVAAAAAALEKSSVEVCRVEEPKLAAARAAWNILMSAELCNNVSRYDGVKYGYRAQNFTNLDELYVNSRSEAFGFGLKKAILFGSETLSTDNYMKVYDKAMRVRRVMVETLNALFETYDAVLMPACAAMAYTEADTAEGKCSGYTENFHTAPASITGMPAVVAGGVQLVGKAFSENTLLAAAEILEKEGK